MPELGDVEGFRRRVAQFRGATVLDVDALDRAVVRNATPQDVRRALVGGQVGEPTRTGKWLLVPVDSSTVLFHFGMTGSLHAVPPATPSIADDRFVLTTDLGELRFRDARRLGGMHLAADQHEVVAILGVIGPDALAVTAAEVRERLATGRGSIKAGMLDQTRVAGIGNFGSDEILWRAGIRPDTPVRELSEAEWTSLHRSMRQVLRATARAGHTPRGPAWLTGARFNTLPTCPRCGAMLEQARIATRTSTFCPVCQPPTRSSGPSSHARV